MKANISISVLPYKPEPSVNTNGIWISDRFFWHLSSSDYYYVYKYFRIAMNYDRGIIKESENEINYNPY